MNQSYNGINSQYAVLPSLPIWGDLEGWVAYTYCANNPMKYVDPTGEEWEDSAIKDNELRNWDIIIFDNVYPVYKIIP